MRPFDEGDMVISENEGVGVVISLRSMTRVAECEFFENISFFSLRTGKECGYSSAVDWSAGDRIKIIRTPRKGGKEARDIVAMLGREHHKYLLSMLKIWVTLDDEIEAISDRNDDYWKLRKRGGFNEQSMSFMLFQKAKSKLGVENE